MGTKMNYDVSDGIRAVRNFLIRCTTKGASLDVSGIRILADHLKEIGVQAQTIENELSRHRWNEQARNERASEKRVMEELQRSGTNVIPFSSERPLTDGHPTGGAA